jgi:hypothetical protein
MPPVLLRRRKKRLRFGFHPKKFTNIKGQRKILCFKKLYPSKRFGEKYFSGGGNIKTAGFRCHYEPKVLPRQGIVGYYRR